MKFYSINQLKPFLERNITVKMNTTLKAYLVSDKDNKSKAINNTVIMAYSKKEAGDLYVKWLKANNWYDAKKVIAVQVVRKTKRNKNFFKPSFYKYQCEIINGQYANYMAKADNKNE